MEVTPRLMITKIVCENFKSYAGIKELGPFHKCFTSIVGPNGSGKSNVIDAMLFVFGYRARKIRSKTVSVLIHNSDNHRDLQSCSVSVHFQKIIDLPGDEFSVVPESQFIVSRTAHKDNTSYYQLNGRKTPFKEIASLLKECGIDLDHNRFLILQGEVEQIALMKPKGTTEHDEGMLEFLEDIIGTSRYKEPIQELAKNVEELNEKRGEKLNRVKVVEREKNELEGAKNEAEEYLSMKKEAAINQYMLYERFKLECSQLESKAKEKKEELETKVNEIKTSVKQQSKEKEMKVKEQKKLYKQYEKCSDVNEKCKSALSSFNQKDEMLRQDLKNTKLRLNRTNENLKKESKKLTELEKTPETNQKEIKEYEQKVKILEKRKKEEEEKLTEVMASLREDTSELQDEKEKLEAQLMKLSQNTNQSKSQLDITKAELELYREKFFSCENQIKEAKEQLDNTILSSSDKEKELNELKSVLPLKRQEFSSHEKLSAELGEKMNQLNKSLQSSRVQVEEAKATMQMHKNRGQVLESLMKQKEKGAIKGIHGRLGDLGSIDDRYDIAISTACSALDYIVVDDMDTAVTCVEYLKTHNIGSATFIGLDKMEVWRQRATKPIKTPENVHRLFDLVKVKDSRFQTCFYYALTDTLVAENLEQATRVGLQGKTRYRVVTLQGHLIDSSGTMSGGGNKVLRGRMSSKIFEEISPAQFSQLEKKLQVDESNTKECLEKQNGTREKLKSLQKEIADSEKKIKQLEREINVLKVQERGIRERIEELEIQNSNVKIDKNQLSKLEKRVQSCQKAYDAAAEETNKVDQQVKQLHNEIMKIGGSRVDGQQNQIDMICKELKETAANITKCSVAIKTSERNAKKSQEKIKSLEADIEKITGNINQLEEEREQLKDEITSITDEQDKAQEEMKTVENLLLSLKEDIESFEKDLRGVNEQLVDLTHELEQYASKVKENQSKIRHFNNEIASLRLGDGDKKEFSKEELMNLNKTDIEYHITMLEEKLKQMSPNMAAIDEYHKKEELHRERLNELEVITNERDKVKNDFETLRKKRLETFMEGFAIITSKLKEMYQMITLGGDAELELVDSLDPFSEGIIFSVRPPKKSWKSISNLSGGEKTLSSLALVFALHHYKPSPLYVMDEIDAALDFKNVSIVANYIKERTKNSQFIIISLRNNMFELADILVGIYKTENITKSIAINPNKIGQEQTL